MRKFNMLLVLTIFTLTIITITPSDGKNPDLPSRKESDVATKALAQDPPGTIDGAVSPQLIPDDVAYSLFFNFVAGRQTEKERNRLKSYLQQVQLAEIDTEALISISQEYQRAVDDIDTKQSALSRTNHLQNKDLEIQLAELQQRRLALVDEKVKSLPARLGDRAAENVRRHVMEYIKRKVKIIPGPTMQPTQH
jgi:hypothetical protein